MAGLSLSEMKGQGSGALGGRNVEYRIMNIE
jgi:hypothetical protein